MSTVAPCRCRRCGRQFEARWGGGFRYVDRYCRGCGAYRCLRYEEHPAVWQAFVEANQAQQEQRLPLRERQRLLARASEKLEQAVQAALGPCPCGGRFSEERPRCPGCAAEDYDFVGEHYVYYD